MSESTENHRYETELREQEARHESQETKRLNAEIPAPMHADFKAKTAKEGRKMTNVVQELIAKYLSEKSE